MTAHLCSTFDPTCWRCDLAADEIADDNCRQCGEQHPDELRHQWPCAERSLTWCVHPSCRPTSDASTASDLPSSTGTKGDSRG